MNGFSIRLICISIPLLLFSGFASALSQADIDKTEAQIALSNSLQKLSSLHGGGSDDYSWMDNFNRATHKIDENVSDLLKHGGKCSDITEKPITKDMLAGNPVEDKVLVGFYKSLFNYTVAQCKWLTSSDE